MSPGAYQLLQGDFIFPHFRDDLAQRAICFLLTCLLQFLLKRFAPRQQFLQTRHYRFHIFRNQLGPVIAAKGRLTAEY